MEGAEVANLHPMVADPTRQMIVTSCEEDDGDFSCSASVNSSENGPASVPPFKTDDLFDEQADDEDEAYVYRNLRSGIEEPVKVARVLGPTSDDDDESSIPRRQLRALKPRNSDAVLSCPCCFRIVCMDCQQHEYYANQYRAMFVMGIAVRWDMKLRYDTTTRCLVRVEFETPPTVETPVADRLIPILGVDPPEAEKDDIDNAMYFSVCCSNCQTTVAALDMTEEVYHFSGCLASP